MIFGGEKSFDIRQLCIDGVAAEGYDSVLPDGFWEDTYHNCSHIVITKGQHLEITIWEMPKMQQNMKY